MLFLPIHIPWYIFLHALGLTLQGLGLLFSTPPRPGQDRSVQGLATVAIGMAYLSTAYMPIHENQFLHASVPVRIFLASLAGFSWAMKRRRPNQDFYTDSNALIAITIYDGLGGVVLGWHLGSFDGKIPAYR